MSTYEIAQRQKVVWFQLSAPAKPLPKGGGYLKNGNCRIIPKSASWSKAMEIGSSQINQNSTYSHVWDYLNVNNQKWYFIKADRYSPNGGLSNRTVSIERIGTPANMQQWKDIITNAAYSWTTSNANVNMTTTNSIRSHVIEVGNYPELTTNVLGCCEKYPQGNVIATSSHIKINMYGSDKSPEYKQGIVAHEMGHLLWLGDNPSDSTGTNSLMNYQMNPETMRNPQAFDVQNVRSRYD